MPFPPKNRGQRVMWVPQVCVFFKAHCFAVLFTIARTWKQPRCPSMEFSRQEYWSGLPLPSPKLPYDPTIPLLGIYPEKTVTEKDTCTPVFTAALFTITRTWKQPRCLLTDEWIKQLWYIYTMEYYCH